MAKTATTTDQTIISGDEITLATYARVQAANANAPPPTSVSLSAGNNTVTVPSGFTVNVVKVFPPSGSSNTKTYKGVTGDTGFVGTSQVVTLPVTAGGTFVINSTGGEVVDLVYS